MGKTAHKRNIPEADNGSERKSIIKALLQLAALAFVVIMFFNVLYSSASTMMKLEEKKVTLLNQIDDYNSTAEQLELELELYQSDSYIEREARAQGFIKDNEIIYKIKR